MYDAPHNKVSRNTALRPCFALHRNNLTEGEQYACNPSSVCSDYEEPVSDGR